MANPIDFKLFAPYNQQVSLIGSFNDWQRTSLEKGDDGFFRTTVDLDDGSGGAHAVDGGRVWRI